MERALKTYLSLSLILFSCSAEVGLTISDLSFADVEREAIKRNQIWRTIMTYHSAERTRSDTIIYDRFGRKVYESYPYNKISMMYDNNGLLTIKQIRSGTFTTVDSAKYDYQSDSLTLCQSWKYDSYFYKYRFDVSGRLSEMSRFKRGSHLGALDVSEISYCNNTPVKIEQLKLQGDKLSHVGSTSFFYSGSKLDSVIQTSSVQRTYKIVYDERGLAMAQYYGGQLDITYTHESGN